MAYNSVPHPHVTALISMAGGRGQSITNEGGLAGIWRPDLLTDAAGRFGRSATTPMLWVFSQNDRYLVSTRTRVWGETTNPPLPPNCGGLSHPLV